MNVIPLTILFSLALVSLFAVLFVRNGKRTARGVNEQSSLLPLDEEQSRSAYCRKGRDTI